jgi:hypothetical protein
MLLLIFLIYRRENESSMNIIRLKLIANKKPAGIPVDNKELKIC